jgi:tetratricopeptide (TPR) repeat protein
MKFKPDFTRVIQVIASLLEQMGQLEHAQQLYQTMFAGAAVTLRRLIVRLQPQNPWAYHNLAKALFAQQQYAAAADACQQAIVLNADSPWFYHTLGQAFVEQGLWQQAIEACQQALALDSTIAWTYHNLAKAYVGQENWEAAIESCQQAIALDASVFWFHYTLGEAQVKAARWQEAIVTFRQAIQLQPSFPWSHFYLGEALVAQGEIDEAVAAYQQAVQLRPGNPYPTQSLEYALHLQHQAEKIRAYRQKMQSQEMLAQKTGNADRPLKILMLTPCPPYPPNKQGALTRIFHEVKCLGERHHVAVVSFLFSKADQAMETALENYCDLSIMVATGDPPPGEVDRPKSIQRYSSQRMVKLLNELKEINFDIVSFNFIYMAQYLDIFPDAFHVLEEHNIESNLLKRCAEVTQDSATVDKLAKQVAAVKAFVESETEAKRLAAYEDCYWQKFPLRTVVSEKDKQTLDSRCSVGQTIVVNNGIDTQSVMPIGNSSSQIVLFIGTMNYYPNIDGVCYFVEQILPIVWQHNPAIQFWVAGHAPPKQIKDLENSRIQVIADPEDMSEVAKNCSVTVVPLRVGSGTRIKILHSMAMGLPVVSTSLGCEGLHVTDGSHLLIRDQPAEFAEAVLQLVADANLWQTLRTNGRQLVEQKYDWQSIFTQAESQIVQFFQEWKTQARAAAIVE